MPAFDVMNERHLAALRSADDWIERARAVIGDDDAATTRRLFNLRQARFQIEDAMVSLGDGVVKAEVAGRPRGEVF